MDFSLNEDQQLLMASVEAMLEKYKTVAHEDTNYVAYSAALQNELIESGFMQITEVEGYGLLEGAMLVEAAASCPHSVEVANSALIAPLIEDECYPLAVSWNEKSPVRYLNKAKSVAVWRDDELYFGSVSADNIQIENSVIAYPLATLKGLPKDAKRCDPELAAEVRRRGLIGLAAEAAGLMRGALESTVTYVKDRKQFGQALGDFQAIQHRLAECVQTVRACKSLAFRAAYCDDEKLALVACLYAQDIMRQVIHDCHQFSGAMGLTLEYPLHYWTYRLKYIQGEMGGRGTQGQYLAMQLWGKTGS